MSVWTLLNNWPMSDRYASIYDWCNWHRIDYLRFYSRVPTIERWPWVSNRQTVQNCPKLHHKYILYLIGDQCDWEIGLFDRWGLMLKKKILTPAATYWFRFPVALRNRNNDKIVTFDERVTCKICIHFHHQWLWSVPPLYGWNNCRYDVKRYSINQTIVLIA